MGMPAENLLPPFKELKQKPPSVAVERRDDGSVLISSTYPLEDMPRAGCH